MTLSLPQRDDDDNVVPHDHAGILPDDWIIRRIPSEWIMYDPKLAGRRITSLAFRGSSRNGGMSVDLQRQIEEAGLDPQEYVTTPRWIGSIRAKVQGIRADGFSVGFNPIEDNPYHGEVWGNFSRANQRLLRARFEWFVPISDAGILETSAE